MDLMVWLGDSLVSQSDACVPVTDRGYTSGDGVFEVLKVVDGVPFAITRHLDRLASSAGRLGLELPNNDTLRHAIKATINANRARCGRQARLRISLTRQLGVGLARACGPATLVVTLGPAPAHPGSVTVVTVPWPRNERALLVGVKTTSYAENLAILDYAQCRGADEALLPDTTGRLAEGTTCNVVVEHEGRLVTPTLATGCLPGVTRALAIEWGIVAEHDVSIGVLTDTKELLITSSTRGLMSVQYIDGRSLSLPGPLGEFAIAEFHRNAAANPDP